VLLGALLLLAPSLPAAALPVLFTGSGRLDGGYLRRAPASGTGVEDGAVTLDGWFDLRALAEGWDAAARLRIEEASGIDDRPSRETIDRRHLAFRSSRLEVRAGNFYTTFGNGLVLRTLEQRFVTLNRTDRAFNLDRNLDGVRVRADLGPVRLTALSGAPGGTVLSATATGGAEDIPSDDLLQGGDLTFAPVDGADLGVSYLRAELASPDRLWEGREEEDLVSYRVRAGGEAFSGEFEYAEIRPGAAITAGSFFRGGSARYLRLEGGAGALGVSLEAKNYKGFGGFPYNQPPTLVRTHESVLLNRATHVLLADDERGFQIEGFYAPGLFTSVTLNVAGADDARGSRGRRFREVFLSGRTEREDLGALRLDLDWSRDRVKFVENRRTVAVEAERFLAAGYSAVVDAEIQSVDSRFGDHTDGLLQLALARAGRWTVSVTGEHTGARASRKREWLFASLDLRVSEHHDLTLGYGSRPAGLVCSGGFCFVSPEFDGAEFRLLSRF